MAIIRDNLEMLQVMMDDYEVQAPINKGGNFWRGMGKKSLQEIRRHGVSDFRGASSGIGWGFSDNIFYEVESLVPRHDAILGDLRTRSLVAQYQIPDTMCGGCLNYVDIDGRRIAVHYLNLLDQLDQITEEVGFGRARCLFEIGGGFGANVHLIAENYASVRKVIYLDIPPNLYVGTQYLKAFYGPCVKDYDQTRDLVKIVFKEDESFEILAIAPWQLPRVAAQVDIFHNAHSFVEMSTQSVAAYAHQASRLLLANGVVSLLSYDCFDLRTTWDPDELPRFFPNRSFKRRLFPVLDGRYGIIAYQGRLCAK